MIFIIPQPDCSRRHKFRLVKPEWKHELLLISESVAEVAAMTIRAGFASKDHATDLSLIARVTDDRAKLINPMSKLAMISIEAAPSLLPFVA